MELKHIYRYCKNCIYSDFRKRFIYSKELIYAIALLHDIGRVMQYEKEFPHHNASVDTN